MYKNEDSPQQQQQQDNPPEEPEEDEEEEDPSTHCPYFATSEKFHFLTINEFERREDEARTATESEYSFAYVRPMNASVGVLENPHGSVRLSQGSTTVIAAVYGPSDVRMSKELPHRAAVDVLFRPKVTGSGNNSSMINAGIMDPVMEERAMEQTITTILESVIHLEDHVQAGFNVILHEVENHGCLLSTCVNAASLALLNAGCSLRCMFACVTVCVCGDRIIIDPTNEQVHDLKQTNSDPISVTTLVISNGTEKNRLSPQILHMSTLGAISKSSVAKVIACVTETDVMSEIFAFFWRTISSDLARVCGMTNESTEQVKTQKEEDAHDNASEEEGELIDDDE